MKNNILESFDIKKPKHIFKTPNTIDKFYGKDQLDKFKFGEVGLDVFTSHVTQDVEWNNINFDYSWNSLGLRGSEPNYNCNKKILFAGGSLCVGTGVPVEHSFPDILSNMLNASYINLSDADNISDFIEPIKQFKSFNPDYVVINDTRFIQLYGWALIDLYKIRDVENNALYKNVFLECDKNFLLMFEAYLKNLFPTSQLILAHCVRRAFKINMSNFEHFKIVRLEREEVVDLARDNTHPGMRTHRVFAEKIYKAILD
jgi:hypothetical protein